MKEWNGAEASDSVRGRAGRAPSSTVIKGAVTASRRWLVASIVLNVFLLGAAGGGLYRWHAQQTRLDALQQRGLRYAADQLPAARQAAFAAALKATRRDPETRALALAARDGRLQIAGLLSAPNLDQDALRDALARTRNADIALRARIETTVATFAATLTPPERLQMVDAMQRHGPLRPVAPESGASTR
ncbi:periplasmic heavy metal sensor [Robbsia andropogonis]|uniref:periplasmic heavy metal sensor n=1 Tax=Robbsia andropogonis TaxID=28092 RepID=UPI000467874A|nr:periplasmic heavy metal sensor [Robbsia andropogonis]MCP1118535.1 periplasmic heavy metal sensor [Robbsia andropogonis]MCP1128002.1 periplasmic heavy metal sensor [Robbsia andropogonis]